MICDVNVQQMCAQLMMCLHSPHTCITHALPAYIAAVL